MSPLTNFDLFLFIEILVKMTLVTHLIRYIITFFLPHEFRDYFDDHVRAVRNHSVNYGARYFPNSKNFEVVVLTRVIIPLLFMLTVNTYLDFLLINYVFGRYLFLGYFFYFVKLYFFLNLAPNLDDLELLYDASGITRLVFFSEILFIFFYYNSLNPLLISFIIIFPGSDIFDINNFQNRPITEDNPSLDFPSVNG